MSHEAPTTDVAEAKFSAIYENSGNAIAECEIIRKLCELRDEKRLEDAISHMVDYARTVAKRYRELQTFNTADAERVVDATNDLKRVNARGPAGESEPS